MDNNKVLEKNSHKKYYCEHGKKYICSICCGSQLCLHNKIKYRCKLCYSSEVCSHGRRKSSCKDCGGGDYCEHSKQKIFCIVCGGSQICSHNKRKSKCKKCSDPIKVIIYNWMSNTKQNDIKYNRYDADRFIDKCLLKGLIEDYPTCYYEDCRTPLQYTKYQYNLATIERINNNIGHIKSNCVLCCLSCNNKRKSNLTSKE